MRYLLNVPMIEKEHGHDELVEELCRLFPDGRREARGETYAWALPTAIDSNSEPAKQIFSVIESYGLHRRQYREKLDLKTQYIYTEERVYSKSDLAVCEWFRLAPKMMISVDAAMDDRHEDLCALRKKAAPKRISYCSINSGGLCPVYLGKTVKEALEQSDLTGYEIRPTLLKIRNNFVPNPEIWELASDHYFPDHSKVLPNPTPRISPEESHYRRSDIEYLEDVDVAYEDKWFDEDGFISAEMFVSKRFYDWWLENNFKHLDFIPCRIVDE